MLSIAKYSIIGLLIGLSSSYVIMTLSVLAIPGAMMSGHELLRQVIIAAILGIVIGNISLIFKSDRFNLTLQFLIHFTAVCISVFIAGFFGKWYDWNQSMTVLSLFLSILIIYMISWGISLILLKQDVNKINRMIQSRKKDS